MTYVSLSPRVPPGVTVPRPRGAFWAARLAPVLALALAGCADLDLPVVGGGAGNAPTPAATSAPPRPDARGVISFPSYQAVRARTGETPAAIAARLNVDAEALSRRNGLPLDQPLRNGELLLLPTRVPDLEESDDLASMAEAALNRAEGGSEATPAAATGLVAAGPEPVRHTVARGETAYSIARLYDVSVRGLADWNGLPADYAVREGQQLLIPLAQGGAPPPGVESGAGAVGAGLATASATTTAEPGLTDPVVTPPGLGTTTPTPPSATGPLPNDDLPAPAAAAPVTTAPLEDGQTTASDTARLAKPVTGRILRGYEPGRNEGVDFAADAGTPVRAADAGTVAAITRDVDQVPIIVVRHADNVLTVYANVDGISVARGDSVSRGQQIAVVRDSDPAFLHFEVREGFESVDPVSYLAN